MSSNDNSRAARVQQSFQKLATGASTLNNLSDQVGKTVAQFDAAFQRLNIGLPAWVRFESWASPDGFRYSHEEVGYDKIDGQWGLAIRKIEGDERGDEYTTSTEWLFNDAPRALRLKAIDKLPELFEDLAEKVARTTSTVEKKLKEVQNLASAISPANIRPPARGIR